METQITISKSKLEDWLATLKKGLEPTVAYSEDPAKMLESAYKLRGEKMSQICTEINTVLYLSNK